MPPCPPPDHEHGEDDDHLDGCDLDFTIDPDDDETADLRVLFPQGPDTPDLEAQAEAWRELGALDA